jgi:hypothetical protein
MVRFGYGFDALLGLYIVTAKAYCPNKLHNAVTSTGVKINDEYSRKVRARLICPDDSAHRRHGGGRERKT